MQRQAATPTTLLPSVADVMTGCQNDFLQRPHSRHYDYNLSLQPIADTQWDIYHAVSKLGKSW